MTPPHRTTGRGGPRCARARLRKLAAHTACILALCGTAAAGTVTVSIENQSGAAAEDAVVVLDPLDAAPAPAHGTAVIDQVNKRFVPRMNVVRTGTSVSFPNSDNIRHQVYSFSKSKTFNLKLYAGNPSAPVVFDKPGLVILGCNIHDTMVAFVAVVDTPYYAKLPTSGAAEFNLPPGRYRLRVWDPNLHTPFAPRTITVGTDPLVIPLALQIDAARDEIADWTD